MQSSDEKPTIKRFYEQAALNEEAGSYQIVLDGRTARTSAKNTLATPHKPLAEAMAQEWNAQGETLDMNAMWLTRQQMVVIDRGGVDRDKWQETFVSYASSELLCYRAEGPDELVARQAEVWQPYLEWAAETRGVDLDVTSGIMAVVQPDTSLAAARRYAENLSVERLFALISATETIKSAILAMALVESFRPADEIFAASMLDESFQAEKWGVDAEAAVREAALVQEFQAISEYLELVS